MNVDTIYKVLEAAEEKNTSFEVAAEILRGQGDIPDMVTKKNLLSFFGLHYDNLRRAYGTGDKKLFADIVRVCIKNNKEEADMLLRAHATGNEKLIAEMEAKYGDG